MTSKPREAEKYASIVDGFEGLLELTDKRDEKRCTESMPDWGQSLMSQRQVLVERLE